MEDQRLGIAEILHLFPSCRPPLQCLTACLSSSVPRFYSIASSPLLHPDSIVVAFSLVRFTCGVPQKDSKELVSKIDRSGLCTSYLERILQPWLQPDKRNGTNGPGKAAADEEGKETACVRIFHKFASTGFQLPGSVESPLILIGQCFVSNVPQ